MSRDHLSLLRMSRQIPADVLEPVLAESLAQLDRQVFDFETLADAQTEGDHGTIICDALEIADLIVSSSLLTRDWSERPSRSYS